MKKSTRRKCESSRSTIAPRQRCHAVKAARGEGAGRGYPHLLRGGGGGHSKFLNFAYPEMHSDAFSEQKSVCLEVIVN